MLQAIATDQVKVIATNQPERHNMIKRNITAKQVQDWAFGQLSLTQHHFSLNPSATNWNAAVRAMYVYQQTNQAFRSPSVNTNKLLKKLDVAHQLYWGDLISMATVECTVQEAMESAF